MLKNNRRNALLFILIICVIIVPLFLGWYFHIPKVELERTVFEYGKDAGFSKIFAKQGLQLIEVEGYEKNRVGLQKVTFTLNNGKRNFNDTFEVEVKDTIYPEILLKSNYIEIEIGEDIDLSSNIIKCQDSIDGDLPYKIVGNIDYNSLGRYNVKVVAEDCNGNITEVDLVVNVVDYVEVKQYNTEKLSVNKDIGLFGSEYKSIVSNIKYGVNTFSESDKGRLKEVINSYLGINSVEYIHYGVSSIKFSDEDFLVIQERLSSIEMYERQYEDYIVSIAEKLSDVNTEMVLVNKVNSYIVNNFSYEITNLPQYSFVESGVGQCYHFSLLFKDICNALGLEAGYVSGKYQEKSHAWNSVLINGNLYYFDVTLNEYYNNTRYSWLSNKEIGVDHTW